MFQNAFVVEVELATQMLDKAKGLVRRLTAEQYDRIIRAHELHLAKAVSAMALYSAKESA